MGLNIRLIVELRIQTTHCLLNVMFGDGPFNMGPWSERFGWSKAVVLHSMYDAPAEHGSIDFFHAWGRSESRKDRKVVLWCGHMPRVIFNVWGRSESGKNRKVALWCGQMPRVIVQAHSDDPVSRWDDQQLGMYTVGSTPVYAGSHWNREGDGGIGPRVVVISISCSRNR